MKNQTLRRSVTLSGASRSFIARGALEEPALSEAERDLPFLIAAKSRPSTIQAPHA
jgi:hypothetical protein